jgi:hypothetical protein
MTDKFLDRPHCSMGAFPDAIGVGMRNKTSVAKFVQFVEEKMMHNPISEISRENFPRSGIGNHETNMSRRDICPR